MFECKEWTIENTIARFFRNQTPELHLIGSDSPTFLAGLLAQPQMQLADRPHLVIVADAKVAEQLQQSISFFAPELSVTTLPGFDVGPFSGLYPNRKLIANRLRWLWEAQNARPGQIFVAPAPALMQCTLPFSQLANSEVALKRNSTLPDDLAARLEALGYSNVPLVEDVGTFAIRGGIVDVFSPAHLMPIRMELFGDIIESLRFFDADSQMSAAEVLSLTIIPAQEVLFSDENRQMAAGQFKASFVDRDVDRGESQLLLQQLAQGQYFHGIEFLLPYFYKEKTFPLDHFSGPVHVWHLDSTEIERASDQVLSEQKQERQLGQNHVICPGIEALYQPYTDFVFPPESQAIKLDKVRFSQASDLNSNNDEAEQAMAPASTFDLRDLATASKNLRTKAPELAAYLGERLRDWKGLDYAVFFSVTTRAQSGRLKLLIEQAGFEATELEETAQDWAQWCDQQAADNKRVHILQRPVGASLRYGDGKFVVVHEEDVFGGRRARANYRSSGTLEQRAHAFNFGDLKPGDLIVHKTHGIGVFEGLKVMPIQGMDAEFIQIKYKDNDRLYLPVYRVHQIQKYSGPSTAALIDKLGGTGWEKTKTKVRSHLRDVASELLQIYAKRAASEREPFTTDAKAIVEFNSAFPYEETDDQLRAIADVLQDFSKPNPMDRLVCGDVGFGKTEVAMRAAFCAVQDRRQVAVIAPTTVLTFQHLQTFKKRFAHWPVEIRSLNRFVPKKEVSETLKGLKEGKVDIVIGTHRLLSQDVQFKNLGLLVIDEEQRFGVKHKERLRKMKASLDTLAMSATPIPRSLNMSLVGIRDLSLINTPPVDRLPTRTFVTKFDADVIRKSVLSEVSRGGQVYFIHNRVQSIYGLADQLREVLPEVRFKVAHGQMEEGELEKVMVEFFHHEIDMLICTTIVESGMDVSSANTMFIDQAHQLGLSQLYQLRGRVGRSKERAYCYLLVPSQQKLDKQAQERLRIIQENTALGSGIRIAQYDLEMRGAGDILGEEQAGHVNSVGYEMYLELLEEAVRNAKGDTPLEADVDPDINVRIPALIPDSYIPDLRIRLAYYKSLGDIESPEDIDRIENEIRDQFGKLPEQVLNLMGLMLIRKVCKDLAVRDLSSGESSVALAFTPQTKLDPKKVIELASRANKKYSITPDNRLRVRINEITWPRIYDELVYLKSLL